jgi:acyl-CoA thioester hydrolase
MARPEAWRRDSASYPFTTSVQTRFQDLDPLGHINNVAMAALFEQGRVVFNRTQLAERRNRPQGLRWLIARVEITYLAEGHFPEPVEVASGIGPIGRSSWTIYSAAFQDGKCIGTCDTTVVQTAADGATPLTEGLSGFPCVGGRLNITPPWP